LAAFTQFASDLDEATFRQIERGKRVTELMKQDQFAPLSVGLMTSSLYAANKGHLDGVEVKKIVSFEKELHAFMLRDHLDLIEKINSQGEYGEDIQAALEVALKQFKSLGTW
jgi:F-type H+-transporting ATPase subunit alpha